MRARTFATGIAGVLLLVVFIFQRRRHRNAEVRQRGCSPAAQMQFKEPFFGLDSKAGMYTNVPFMYKNHKRYGLTVEIRPWLAPATFATIAPENIRAINTDKDWGVESMRLKSMEPFAGRGFLNTDGTTWQNSRKLLKPTFAKGNLQDLQFLSQQVDSMFAELPADGQTVDLQPHFFTIVRTIQYLVAGLTRTPQFLNTSIKFLLAVDPTKKMAGAPQTSKDFIAYFHDALNLTMFRAMLGPLWFLFPQMRYKKVCRANHDYIDYAIDLALRKDAEANDLSDSAPVDNKHLSLIGGVTAQTEDRYIIRSQIIQGMMASQETTSSLLGNACFLLSRHPSHWQDIRAAAQYANLDFDTLLNLEVVQNVLRETLRLYPIFHVMGRVANQDSILPVGGGPHQTEPVFVPKGSACAMNYYALHRNPAVYGDDVETFRPERWKTIQPTHWEFMGFGGGNRECLGKQKVLVEAAYVLLRLAQRFEVLESRDKSDWVGENKLTCKSKNGCKVALYRN